jgi:hypothetical protein
MDDFLTGRSSRPGPTVIISPAENGFTVEVHNPVEERNPDEKLYKALLTAIPKINNLAGRGAVRGMEEEMDPYKENDESRDEKEKQAVAEAEKLLNAVFDDKPSRKPVEHYVFSDMEKLLSFVREQLSVSAKQV